MAKSHLLKRHAGEWTGEKQAPTGLSREQRGEHTLGDGPSSL